MTSTPSRLPLIAALLLATFGTFSVYVVATRGYLGFVTAAENDIWALQMLIDLLITSSFAIGWMVKDARGRGIATWPFVIATIFLGSIGVLVYCVRRGFAPVQSPALKVAVTTSSSTHG